ncbi:diacylglycerol kinase family protein [Marinicrinis lubricantis]|uniref:Diacylglycerol kinase family protein n=1 Tax=Marinicrinis lubricantis TaxID=2086470 RepID=A0ABW1IUM7_9BACL
MNPWRKSAVKSFTFAAQGIAFTLRTQRNLQLHFIAGLGVVILSFLLGVGTSQLCLLILAMAMVIACELLNTAVECIVDLVQPEFHPLAKAAKDTAAAAVLVSAVFAVCIGILILLPEIVHASDGGTPLWRWLVMLLLGAAYFGGLLYSAWYKLTNRKAEEHQKKE